MDPKLLKKYEQQCIELLKAKSILPIHIKDAERLLEKWKALTPLISEVKAKRKKLEESEKKYCNQFRTSLSLSQVSKLRHSPKGD
jgi:hypothetical protein